MFAMVVFVFALTNGEPADKPLFGIENKTPFASEEKCMNFFDTEEGAKSKASLMQFITDGMEGKPFTVGLKCIAKQDNSI